MVISGSFGAAFCSNIYKEEIDFNRITEKLYCVLEIMAKFCRKTNQEKNRKKFKKAIDKLIFCDIIVYCIIMAIIMGDFCPFLRTASSLCTKSPKNVTIFCNFCQYGLAEVFYL